MIHHNLIRLHLVRRHWLHAAFVCLLPSACLFAQEAEEAPLVVRRPSIGLRVEYTQTRLFETSTTQSSTTKPIADYNYRGSSPGRNSVLSPFVEYRLLPRLSMSLEFRFLHAQYAQVTEIRSGTKDPNASTDDRKVTTITETTKASYLELPLLAHYYGLRDHGLLAKAYLTGGMVMRHIGNVRTGNEFSNADGTTDYNEIAAKPDRSFQMGLVGGAGFRFVDDYRIKIAPEIRVIHWQGTTFHGEAFRSAGTQLSAGLGISF